MGAPYFPKSVGATFQSYFREDKKLTQKIFLRTLRFQNKTATWLHDLGEYSKTRLRFFFIVGWSEWRNGKFRSGFSSQIDSMVEKIKTLTKQRITAA